ncbi:M23 family metallopeptidase [Verrucosispora sp. WMMD1129]|uniref:M23 family metallopeptidase n=1 Tax=Verrucosispora sp. WMMD1129 TaxID=3016093 RepID=UPI00249A180B|nr:M23 family metallopeptidase [Verrucosispora sp. WMMD1129]WFE47666.1 M23 family metallopeptidase [Verrucosispora sp. WMMD1129]
MGSSRVGLGVAVAAAMLLCGLPVAVVVTSAPADGACLPSNPPASALTGTTSGSVGRWNAEQVGNAAIIVEVGHDRQMLPRGWVIAVATAMVESSLRNLPGGDRDSLGLFQQRPSQGWGTPEQILDPVYASTRFYDKLERIDGWQQLPLTVAAQRVQVSAFPDRYGEFEHDAEQVVTAVAGVATIGDLPGASLTSCPESARVAASGWTVPLQAAVGSGYGPRGGRLHAGVDMAAPRHTVIRAASAGTVVWAGCDPSTGNCDIDGSPRTRGCGWYVDLVHPGGFGTRYCHLIRRPTVADGDTVQAGQPIGEVGSSGRSSGPHLHFQTHEGVCTGSRCDLNNANSVDPQPFMSARGAPLEGR